MLGPLSGLLGKHRPLRDTGARQVPDKWEMQRAGADQSVWAERAGAARAWGASGPEQEKDSWHRVLGEAVLQSHLEGEQAPAEKL